HVAAQTGWPWVAIDVDGWSADAGAGIDAWRAGIEMYHPTAHVDERIDTDVAPKVIHERATNDTDVRVTQVENRRGGHGPHVDVVESISPHDSVDEVDDAE